MRVIIELLISTIVPDVTTNTVAEEQPPERQPTALADRGSCSVLPACPARSNVKRRDEGWKTKEDEVVLDF